jgi:DNA topoisomerase VI subunit A
LVKNNLILSINKSIINLNDLGFELSLSDEMIDSLIINDCNVTKVITVENLTTFYGLDDKDAVIIYLAGFHNHTKQKLLLKIYEKFPEAKYYHFSDIDAGGFLIYNNLKNKTQIPFIPYRMDINELVNNKDSLKCLTENDRKRLEKMLTEKDFEVFYKTINYMLEYNVKLEQEILD